MQHQNQRLFAQLFFGPDVVPCKDAVFFYSNSLESGLDILGINVLAAFGDDHILLAPEQLQMTGAVEPSQISGEQPTIHDCFGRELRIIEVMGHDRWTFGSDLTNAI